MTAAAGKIGGAQLEEDKPVDPTAGSDDLETKVWTYPRLVVKRTGLMCAINLLAILVMVAIPIAVGHLKLTKETDFDWVISTEDASIWLDALNSANSQSDTRAQEATQGRRQLSNHFDNSGRRAFSEEEWVQFIYVTKDGGSIMTPEHLQTICEIENIIVGDSEIYPLHCTLNTTTLTGDENPDWLSADPTLLGCAPQRGSILYQVRVRCVWMSAVLAVRVTAALKRVSGKNSCTPTTGDAMVLMTVRSCLHQL